MENIKYKKILFQYLQWLKPLLIQCQMLLPDQLSPYYFSSSNSRFFSWPSHAIPTYLVQSETGRCQPQFAAIRFGVVAQTEGSWVTSFFRQEAIKPPAPRSVNSRRFYFNSCLFSELCQTWLRVSSEEWNERLCFLPGDDTVLQLSILPYLFFCILLK
jgi:hypothetical protein